MCGTVRSTGQRARSSTTNSVASKWEGYAQTHLTRQGALPNGQLPWLFEARPISADWCSRTIGAVSRGRSIGRTAMTWRHGYRSPLPRLTMVRAVGGLYSQSYLYYISVFSSSLSLSLSLIAQSAICGSGPCTVILRHLNGRPPAECLPSTRLQYNSCQNRVPIWLWPIHCHHQKSSESVNSTIPGYASTLAVAVWDISNPLHEQHISQGSPTHLNIR